MPVKAPQIPGPTPQRLKGKMRPLDLLSNKGSNANHVSTNSANVVNTHNAEVGKHLMKTKICSLYMSGKCHYGANRCFYAHSVVELREQPQLVKTSLCLEFKRFGKCIMGESCRYAHSVAEMTRSAKKVLCLWYANGHCSHGSSCRFSHEDNLSFSGSSVGGVTGSSSFSSTFLSTSKQSSSPCMDRELSLEEGGVSTCMPSTPVVYRRELSSDSNISSGLTYNRGVGGGSSSSSRGGGHAAASLNVNNNNIDSTTTSIMGLLSGRGGEVETAVESASSPEMMPFWQPYTNFKSGGCGCLVCGGDSESNCICRVFEECSELLRLL